MLIEKANTGKDVYALVREGWQFYKAAGSGASGLSLATESTRASTVLENSQNKDKLNLAELTQEQIELIQSFVEVLQAPEDDDLTLATISLVKGWRKLHAAPGKTGSKNRSDTRKPVRLTDHSRSGEEPTL